MCHVLSVCVAQMQIVTTGEEQQEEMKIMAFGGFQSSTRVQTGPFVGNIQVGLGY